MRALNRIFKGRGRDAQPVPLSRKVLNLLRRKGGAAIIPGVTTNQGFTPGNYSDSTGTTPASIDGSVGLVVNAAGSVGSELLPVLDFTTWGVAGGVTGITANSVTTSSTGGVTYNIVGGAGKCFEITISGTSTANLIVRNSSNSDGQVVITAGTFLTTIRSPSMTAISSHLYIAIVGAGTLSNVTLSIRELTGIHALQATAGYKPTERRGLVNLLTYSNDFSNAVWSRTNCAIASGQSDPAGGMTAQRIVESLDASTVNHLIGRASNVATVGAIQTLAAVVAPSGRSVVRLQLGASAAAFDVSSGSVVSGSGATIAPAGNGYYLCAFSQTVVTNGNTLLFLVNNGQTSYQGDGNSGLKFAGEALFDGALTAKQILDAGGIPVTTSAPASSANGVNYWRFDGVDDRLQLSAVPFLMTDDFAIVTPMLIDSAVTGGLFAEGSTTLALPSIKLRIVSGVPTFYLCDDTGTTINLQHSSAVVGAPVVISCVKRSGTCYLRVNGSVVAQSSTVLGTATLDVATIGARVYAGSLGDSLSGCSYGLLLIKGTLTESELLLLEKQAAKFAGFAL